MGIQFKINVRRKIVVNGHEYGSVEEMPGDLRRAYEKRMGIATDASAAVGRGNVTTKMVVNGQEYASVDDMPPEVRAIYEMARRAVDAETKGGTEMGHEISGSGLGRDGKPGFFRRLFPRTLLQWTEPRTVQKARNALESRNLKRLWWMMLLPSFLFIGVMGVIAPESMPRMIAVLALVAVGMGFILWSYRTFPFRVRITDIGIVHDIKSKNATWWKFTEMDHCEIASASIGGEVTSVLVIVLKRGERIPIGIAPSIPVAKLQVALESRNVRVILNASPASEMVAGSLC